MRWFLLVVLDLAAMVVIINLSEDRQFHNYQHSYSILNIYDVLLALGVNVFNCMSQLGSNVYVILK